MGDEQSPISLRNVDLDIESRDPIDQIIEEFGEDVMLLFKHNDDVRHRASFELAHDAGDTESIIAHFCILINGLPDAARKQWDACAVKNFDIGYESGTAPNSYRSIIHPETVQSVADLGGAIAITIYPEREKAKSMAAVDPPA